jgi:signal transduction histidine kinase
MPVIFFCLGVLILVLLAGAGRITEIQRENFALMDAIMDMRIRASTFHLWLEEHIFGAPLGSVEDFWGDLESATYLSRTLLRGGGTEHGRSVAPLVERPLRELAESAHAELLELRAIAEQRLRNPAAAGIDSPLDEAFDAIFREFQKKAKALEWLVEEGEARTHARRRRLMIAVTAVWTLILVVATGGLFQYQRRRICAEEALLLAREDLERANQELEGRVLEKTETLRVANEELTREVAERRRAEEALFNYQERLRTLSSQLSLTEERERRRIATDLHDRIGTALAFAKLKLATALGSEGPVLREGVAQGLRLIEEAIEDTQSLTLQLSPPILYELGLPAALGWLAERVQREHGITLEFADDGLVMPLAEDPRVLLFQAARELLVNVVKHARASRGWILCRRDGEDVQITVEDDGVGFKTLPWETLPEEDGGFGLFSIRERLSSVGGLMEIEPRAGGGARITLVVPAQVAEVPPPAPGSTRVQA